MAEPAQIRLSDISDPKYVLRAVNEKSERFISLVDSIREHGVLSAITVRPAQEDRKHLGPYELVTGRHRCRASARAGRNTISALIRYDLITDEQLLIVQIEENAQHIETQPVEYARHLKRLKELRPDWSATQLAAAVHMSRTWVYRMFDLLRLAPSIQTLVDEGDITFVNAVELARLPQACQLQLVVQAGTMPLHEFRELVSAIKRKNKHKWQHDRFSPQAIERPLRSIKAEREHKTNIMRLLALANAKTQLEAVELTLDWVMKMDSPTLEQRRQKHSGLADLRQLYKEGRNEIDQSRL